MQGQSQELEAKESLCVDGQKCDPPPCVPCCERRCSCCCYKIGSCGVRKLGEKQIRAPLFLFCAFLSAIQICMQVWSAFALSSGQDNIKNSAWSVIEVEGHGHTYAGLTHVYTEMTFGNSTMSKVRSYDDYCDDVSEVTNSNYTTQCDDCKAQALGFHVAAITNIISKVGQYATDLTRSRVDYDVNCQKAFGMISGTYSSMMTIYMLSFYAAACANELPKQFFDPLGHEYTATSTYGIGFFLCLIGQFFGLFDAFVHCLVPCPEDAAEPGYIERRWEINPPEQKCPPPACEPCCIKLGLYSKDAKPWC